MRPFVALFCLFLRHTFWKVLLLLAALGMFALLRMADTVVRALHRTGIAVLSKLTGLLLAAIAAQVIFTGIRAFLG